MSAASWALQQAIFATLSASTDLQALIGDPPRVYDAVPREAMFPYVVIGGDDESDWSTKTEQGSVHLLSIDIWSRAAGYKQAKAIAQSVRDALDEAQLALSGATLVDIFYQGETTARQADGETIRATLIFRAVVEA